MKILITGATGYIGSEVLRGLARDSQFEALGVVRNREQALEIESNSVIIPSIDGSTDWSALLGGVECIIHLAGVAHKPNLTVDDFRGVNTFGTLNLAKQAKLSGVKRFVFISSIGVNGSHTLQSPFDEESTPLPHSNYAISKLEAENGLWELAGSEMDVVVIRPPLVYGANAPGNFSKLLKLVSHGLPWPIREIQSKRSMIAIENLISFIKTCIHHPLAANELYVVSDEDALSLQEIIEFIAKGMNINLRTWSVPIGFLEIMSIMLGKKEEFTQLSKSLVIHPHKAQNQLGWNPSIRAEDALICAGKLFSQRMEGNVKNTGMPC